MENALHMEDDMMHAMQGVWHSFELCWHLKSGSASFKIVNLFKDTFSLQLFSQFILCNDPECDHTHPVPPLWRVGTVRSFSLHSSTQLSYFAPHLTESSSYFILNAIERANKHYPKERE